MSTALDAPAARMPLATRSVLSPRRIKDRFVRSNGSLVVALYESGRKALITTRLLRRATKRAGENAGIRRRNWSPNYPAILCTVAATRPTGMAGGGSRIFHRQAVCGEGRIEDIVDVQPFMKEVQQRRNVQRSTLNIQR